jgi:hypothetical protein
MNRLRSLITGLAITLVSCGQQSQETIVKTDTGFQEFFNNGFIKTQVIRKSDSLEDKYFYNRYDSGHIDSLYRFKLFYDTMLPWQQYIYSPNQVNKELSLEKITLDSGDYIRFHLLKPKYDIIAIHLRKNQIDRLNDTTYQGSLRPLRPQQFYLRNPHDSLLNGFVIDWGFWSKTDTVGSIALQHNRYLKFEIRDRE